MKALSLGVTYAEGVKRGAKKTPIGFKDTVDTVQDLMLAPLSEQDKAGAKLKMLDASPQANKVIADLEPLIPALVEGSAQGGLPLKFPEARRFLRLLSGVTANQTRASRKAGAPIPPGAQGFVDQYVARLFTLLTVNAERQFALAIARTAWRRGALCLLMWERHSLIFSLFAQATMIS